MTDPLRETEERIDRLHRQVLAAAEVWVLAADRPQRDMHIVDKARIAFMAALATALRTARDEAWAEVAKVADGHAALWEREASKFRIGTDTWTACRIRMHVAMDIATAIRASKDEQR